MIKMIRMYCYNWMVLLSKGLNTLLGGTPHESSSQKIGRKARSERGYWKVLAESINKIFYLFGEVDHIGDALDGENKSKDIWDEWRKKKESS